MSEQNPTADAPAQVGGPAALLARLWPALVVAIILLGAGGWWFKHAFDDRGYAPAQPIAFSHRQHAGDLRLDCRFCHFNAERGRHAGVPPMSVCMGCHATIAADKPDIRKLAEIAATGSYTDADGSIRQGGVVHWNRVHKLPDHVIFDHAAHVAGGVACQDCHGPVETMAVLRQHADLTMGWCLDCHRQKGYVGGPGSDPGDPKTWRVGTPDYAARREREVADPVVVFHERVLKGAKPADHAAAPAPAPAAAPAPPADAAVPAWRRAALPDSHRLMNAPTNCSTCHQ